MKKRSETLLFTAWAVSLAATLGSLFFSEILNYTPCELCWYQRILMYPLVVIYGASLIRKNTEAAAAGLVLSGIGAGVSLYHYMIQKVPAFQSAGDSCGAVPCNAEYINWLGFITIPFLAGTAFIIIFVSHVLTIREQRRNS
ncbi:putative disulfide formation protein [Halobacillus andaensis]|uniref:Probable disulfide formation protein n=1 Tax=Halobacillus andaensis TaxID=1176239 RepID=A0A917B1C9_HALAA|nr:disulfide oxidoreductase [Halobacillus andaensis]MBP2004117.1 disulfide bond formation protein DsbB [Halobacillus andaensis]GGF15934.1 putative disulfide formation protein [Halobacillus andaensis]